jgi:hypothetical protein
MSRIRNFGMRVRRRVARARGEPIRDRVGANDEVLVGIEGLARADEKIEPMMIAADRGDHQDRIRLPGVERAMRDVGDGEVLDRLAALDRKIADAI